MAGAMENPDAPASSNPDLRHPCQDLMRYLSNGSFYFSTAMDLTRSLQQQHAESPGAQPALDFDECSEEFLWNRHMLKDLLYIRDGMLDDEKAELDASGLMLAMVQGFVGAGNVRIQDRSGSLNQLVLISRLSCRRAGTRFSTRGVDDEGNVANFVETELVLDSPQYLLSFVQLRGSVPIFWEQPGVQGFTQRIEIARGSEATGPAFRNHFARLVEAYGDIQILNLLSAKEPEVVLTSAYRHHFERSIPELQEAVQLKNFDVHAECRNGNFDNLVYLYSAVAKWLDRAGYFLFHKDSRHPLLLQGGHLRINCLDCLDRTNVVQTFMALQVVTRHAVEYLDADPVAVFSPEAEATWRNLWSDNGDALSKIYAGSGAIRSSATRKGKQTLAGILDDASKSVQRFVVNNFVDKSRQETIDILLGTGIPEKSFLLRDVVREAVAARMKARESEYTRRRTVHALIGTWNVNGKTPGEDLSPWLESGLKAPPEFIALAFQEIVELTPQQIVAADVNRRIAWEKDLLRTMNYVYSASYVLLRSVQLVGASLSLVRKLAAASSRAAADFTRPQYALENLVDDVRHVEVSQQKTGLSGLAGNKGGVAIRLNFHDTSLCFVTAHLAAGQSNVADRNRDYRTITDGIRFRGKRLEDHDFVIFAGDFNYRVDLDYESAIATVQSVDTDFGYQELLAYDQLIREHGNGRVFEGYTEAKITFPPTYKIANGTVASYENEKGRVPAWCDRILYRSASGQPLELLDYSSVQTMTTSDHKPVKAVFRMEAQIVDHAKAGKIRGEILASITRSGRAGAAHAQSGVANGFKAAQWWDDGKPLRRTGAASKARNPFRSSETLERKLAAKNPFREIPAQVAVSPASPPTPQQGWVTFDD
ncbi:inositol polyphosphate phosphatase [Hyaloraphidium curvatum]|nr:inositol polyphosphate phosphatase [Hyaloraphidium curvatum]